MLDGVLKGDCNFCVCGRNPMMWPFKWKLPACTYTWYFLFFKMLENEIWKSGRNLPLTTFGSERLNSAQIKLKDVLIKLDHHLLTRPDFIATNHYVFLTAPRSLKYGWVLTGEIQKILFHTNLNHFIRTNFVWENWLSPSQTERCLCLLSV